MSPVLIIKEVEYAIRIIEELNREAPLSAARLSDRQDIPSPFIYRILKKLESGGIVEIKRGAKGGYRLKVQCSHLTLYDVICAFENTFLVIECMKSGYDCENIKDIDCCMHKEFARVQSLLKTEFKRNSLEKLLEKRP
ncbi:MAG: Rrf2 family transcriptional regulator [Clostridiales bacterium]|nr:Rrf2 family transcriptional regulator [Clostridiales bacterium]